MNFQGRWIGAEARNPAYPGSPHKKKLTFFKKKKDPTKNYCIVRPTLEKKIVLAFLKVVCPYNPY
jgi:hypothetical protein